MIHCQFILRGEGNRSCKLFKAGEGAELVPQLPRIKFIGRQNLPQKGIEPLKLHVAQLHCRLVVSLRLGRRLRGRPRVGLKLCNHETACRRQQDSHDKKR